MSIYELDQVIGMVNRANNNRALSVVRQKIEQLLDAGSISMSLYSGLNQDIRDRADWLRSRK